MKPQAAPPPSLQNPSLEKNLRITLLIVPIFACLAIFFSALMLDTLLGHNQTLYLLSLSAISLIAILITAYVVWKKLAPLQTLFVSAQYWEKGHLDHRLNIHTGDEFETIGNLLNQMSLHLTSIFESAAYHRDISQLEQNRLNIILSSLSDGIMVVNIHKQIVFMNENSEKLTGWTIEEILGTPLDQIMSVTDQSGSPITSKDFCPIDLTGQVNVKKYENENILILTGKGGKKAYISLNSMAVNAILHTDLGCILVLRDIQKQKQLESMQLDFVSMASHELRTPITSIKGYLSVFMNENKDKLNQDQKDFLERIQISTQTLAALVENLLSVAKVERGGFSINATPVDWQQTLKQVVIETTLQASQKNITITLQLPSEPLPKVLADQIRIIEVVNNLVNNAINYTPEGGKIVVSAKKLNENEVVTAVADTGKGIPREALNHLFTKFFRVQGAMDHSSNSKGNGLGLYLSKSIVDLHHGKIWAASPGAGLGSTFFFTLPIAQRAPLKARLASLDVRPLGL